MFTKSTAAAAASPLAVSTSRGSNSNLEPDLCARRQKRTSTYTDEPSKVCQSLSYSLEELDVSSASPIQTLASLRFLVLSHLADLERRLPDFESPTFETWSLHDKFNVEEATQWAHTSLEMLERIRADVCSHLPEFQFADLSSLESLVKAHLPDVPNLTEVRSHLPDMPNLPQMRSHLPDMDNVRSRFSNMRLKLDDLRTRFHELDFQKPLRYIPILSNNLHNLHTHLSSIELPSGLTVSSLAPSTLAELLDALLSSQIVTDILNSPPDVLEADALLERTSCEVTHALKQSSNGLRLITYPDLAIPWRNNSFVTHGYR